MEVRAPIFSAKTQLMWNRSGLRTHLTGCSAYERRQGSAFPLTCSGGRKYRTDVVWWTQISPFLLEIVVVVHAKQKFEKQNYSTQKVVQIRRWRILVVSWWSAQVRWVTVTVGWLALEYNERVIIANDDIDSAVSLRASNCFERKSTNVWPTGSWIFHGDVL